MKKGFTVKEVKPRIFFMNFEKQYDCNMTFMRYQETYESPNPKFRGKQFEIIEFMEWYSQKYGEGAFTYAVDWAGFNIPGKVIDDVLRMGVTDYNKYDAIMEDIWSKGIQKYPDEKFYVIGAVGEKWALKHEIAHGFFYTESAYKKEATKLVKALPKTFRNRMNKVLENIGYTPKVFIDETQAYLSTGVPEGFKIKADRYSKPFTELYNRFYNVK